MDADNVTEALRPSKAWAGLGIRSNQPRYPEIDDGTLARAQPLFSAVRAAGGKAPIAVVLTMIGAQMEDFSMSKRVTEEVLLEGLAEAPFAFSFYRLPTG